jgi:O-antigen/teichoic acid export membrane protein
MSLRKQAYKGVKWTAFATLLNTIVQFVQIAILAHLLTPKDFGLVAMVMIIIGFGQLFKDAGISSAIIYYQDISQDKLSSLYWLNIFSGFVIFLIIILISPLAVSFFNEPRIQDLFYVASLLFLVIPIGQQFQILMQKELNFERIAKIETIARFVGMIVAIYSAYIGVGAISIIYGQIANSVVRSLLLLYFGIYLFKPKLHFNAKDLKGFVSFGLYEMGRKSINYFNSRVDQLIIGKMLGATDLGYYSLAFNLIIMPVSRINPILTRVAFPIFAKVQDDLNKLKKGFFESIKYLTLINFPLLIGLAVLAEPFVLVVYGKQWTNSILLIQILAFVAIFRSIGNPCGSLILAKGRPDLGFKWNLFILFVSPPAIYLSAQYSIYAVAFTLFLLQIIYFVLYYPFILKPLIGFVKKEWFIDSFLKPFLLTMFMGIVVYIINTFVEYNSIISLSIGICAGILTYFFIILIFERQYIYNLKDLIFS